MLPEGSPTDLLPDDESALLALVALAQRQEGFKKAIKLRVERDGVISPVVFEVLWSEDGPIVQEAGGGRVEDVVEPAVEAAPAPPTSSGPLTTARLTEVLTNALILAPDLVAVFASVGHEALWANDAFATLLPVRRGDKLWMVDLLDEWSRGHYEVNALPALFKYGRWQGHLNLTLAKREPVRVSAVLVAHRDRSGEVEAVSMVARQLRGREVGSFDEAEEIGAAALDALAENSSDLIVVVDGDFVVRYASPETCRILGYEPGSLTGTSAADLIHPDEQVHARIDTPDERDELGLGRPIEIRLRGIDGTWHPVEAVATNLADNPAIGGVVLNARDLSERVSAVAQLTARAYSDAVTGLATRVRLVDRLAASLTERAERELVGVLLIAVDRFASVHDALGQNASDDLLAQFARNLLKALPEGAVGARVNEGEFACVLPGMADEGDAMALAEAVSASCRADYQVGGAATGITSTVAITCSIGVVVVESPRDPDDVLRDALSVLEVAKQEGGDRPVLFDAAHRQRAERRLTIEQILRRALAEDGVDVHYQPVIDLTSLKTIGAEALLRVSGDDGSMLSPAEFIEAAEDNGLITLLGTQVLRTTCNELRDFAADAPEIHVNVSPRQLLDPALPDQVLGALKESGVAPERLCLEITERVLIAADPTVDQTLAYLRAMGVRVGLDDFGAGQSSLGYLKRFPLDFVKIDRSLVKGLGVQEQDTAIVRATIDLAHNLGLVVIAVGVENRDQLDYLKLLGCDRAQGFHFSAPITGEAFTERIAGERA